MMIMIGLFIFFNFITFLRFVLSNDVTVIILLLFLYFTSLSLMYVLNFLIVSVFFSICYMFCMILIIFFFLHQYCFFFIISSPVPNIFLFPAFYYSSDICNLSSVFCSYVYAMQIAEGLNIWNIVKSITNEGQ